MPRRVVILGATGSVGLQAIDVVDRSEGELVVTGLSAATAWEPLLEDARRLGVKRIALADPHAAAQAAEAWTDGEVLSGPDGIVALVAESGCDLVLNAIVGAAGLLASVATLGEGIDLALANKESLVVGGELVNQLAEATGARIIPVDSEHSALHQLIAGERPGTILQLILTASGGPFRGRSAEALEAVKVSDALQHPTWSMGAKITVDSATLMNKGLEVIEAHHLFGTSYDDINVVVHPQSIIHAMVQLIDGATMAHMGYPDMRMPIAYGLHYPERAELPIAPLDLAAMGALNFERPNVAAFPCLRLAYEAGRAGGTAPCTMNAANEVAVHAFLSERLGFSQIPAVIEETMDRIGSATIHSFETLTRADAEARAVAGDLVDLHSSN